MAGFTENALVRKLQDLNSSQQSIQTLSLWLIHHRKHHAAVVKAWFKELFKVEDSKQLTFMYLANDVIQNSKKKGPEYGKEFGEVLVESFKHMAKTGINAKTKHSLHRILAIWQERGVYGAAKIQEFKEAVDPKDALPDKKESKKLSKRKSTDIEEKEPEKKPKLDSSKVKNERRRNETPGVPPEPEELIRALLELEGSSNEGVRERIERDPLPQEESEVHLFSKLQGKMTPYFRVNYIIKLVIHLRKLNCYLRDNAPPGFDLNHYRRLGCTQGLGQGQSNQISNEQDTYQE